MVSDEQLIEDLQQFAEELGKTPTYAEMRSNGPWSAYTYQRHFGSWNKALEAADLKINKYISKEQLIEDLQQFAEKLGKTPTCEEMRSNGPWSGTPYGKHFGSWNKALEAADLEINQEKYISKEQLIEDLQQFAEKLGKTPTHAEMDNSGHRGVQPYYRHFGSWNKALEAAGLEINEERDISNEQLIKDLQQFAERLGKTPTHAEMNNSGPWSGTAYEKHFGLWNEALEAADLKINRLGPAELAGTGEEAYGAGYTAARDAVLERDKYKCRVCEKTDQLHCHHIKPRRTFDDVSKSNTKDNLITLCASCHQTFEGKWQDANPDEFAENAKQQL